MSRVPYITTITLSLILFITACSGAESPTTPPSASPPFSGTIFLDPDIITASDPTTLLDVTFMGEGVRTMFDRRVDTWVTENAYLFHASYDDGLTAEGGSADDLMVATTTAAAERGIPAADGGR